MRFTKNYIILFFSLLLLSCEDKINPALESAAPLLVVDAWLNNKPGSQVIILTQSQPYFESTNPPGVSGADVTVTDDKGKVFTFVEDGSNAGYYRWTPPVNEVFGTVGNKYSLSIKVNGEIFEASSAMGRVPVIDSLTYDTEKRTGSTDSLTRGQFWATDPEGSGDTYWIRTYKNGVYLTKPSEINVAYDAGFSGGGVADGVVFITPIRRGINSRDEDADGRNVSPIVSGDSLNVQIHSVTLSAFNYLNQVAIQTDRPGGFQELFSTPLANVSTNITNTNANGSKALGFFNVSAVSSAGKRYKKK
ncbi:MAG: DUF4249 domain-containing protein [Cyclobacteriaceae bacterium]|nr:DUF4249 domain-containing protein [Cyclobacteriaceae bacterium]